MMKYEQFTSLIQELQVVSDLSGVSALLGWDQETYMPKGSIGSRSRQSALLSKLAHQYFTGDSFTDVLSSLVDLQSGELKCDDFDSDQSQLLHLVYYDWKKATTLPVDFVSDFSKLVSESQHYWQRARENQSFNEFAPYLEKVISFSKLKAEYLGYRDCPYDALLNEYERGMTVSMLNPIFDSLKSVTLPLIKQLRQLPRIDLPPIDFDTQWALGMEMLTLMGFNFDRGRQDLSTHPFTTQFDITDVRLTTRIDESNFMDGFSSTIHEGGHGLYEQGLDMKWAGTPLAEACSLGIHESQSRLWEKLIGMSHPFWTAFYPKLNCDIPLDSFFRSINYVEPSLIRVQADELTYNIHILIRYEIELMMINDQVSVKDLPDIWNQKYMDYLGVSPKHDSDGILQDVHWSAGLIGYFPTYTLGNVYSVQLFNAAKRSIPNLVDHISNLNFQPLTQWLKRNIHEQGRRYLATDLIKQVTGEDLSSAPFNDYICQKIQSL